MKQTQKNVDSKYFPAKHWEDIILNNFKVLSTSIINNDIVKLKLFVLNFLRKDLNKIYQIRFNKFVILIT